MAPKKETSLALCTRLTGLGNGIAIRMFEYLSTSKHQVHGFQSLATEFLDLSRTLWSIEAGLTDATYKRNQLPSDMVQELDKQFRQLNDEFIVLNQMVLKFVDSEKKGSFMKGLRMMFADTDVDKMRGTLAKSRGALTLSSAMFRWSIGDAKADASVGIGYTGLAAALQRVSPGTPTALPPLQPPPEADLPEPPLERPLLPPLPIAKSSATNLRARNDDFPLAPGSPERHSSYRAPSTRSATHSVRDTVYHRHGLQSVEPAYEDGSSDDTNDTRTRTLVEETLDLDLHDTYPNEGIFRKGEVVSSARWTPRTSSQSKLAGGKVALVNAVQQKKHRILEQLLENGSRADGQVETGMLRTAAQNRDAESINLLLRHGADANGVDKEGFTPLLAATQVSFFEGVKLLLKHGADPNLSSGPDLDSPLALAACENRIDLVQMYVKHGGDANFVLGSGNTALVRSMSQNASTQVVEILLSSGGDANAKNGDGTTALFQAIQIGRVDLMTVLLDHGANPNMPGPKHPLWPSTYKPKALQLLLARGADHKKTPGIMELAASLNKIESIALLMRAGVSPNVKKDGIYTPLCSAIRDNSADILTFLLENGADPNLNAAEYPTFKCITHKRIHFLPQLVAAGADLHKPKGIIETAVAHNDKDAVLYLLDKGVNPNDRTPEGNTALTTAIRDGRTELLDLLLANGADAAVRGQDWPLCMAVKRPAMLKKLLAVIANPRTCKGVIEMAVVANELESIRLLLKAGVSVEDKNCGVFSPLTTAIRENHKAIVRFLLDEADANPNAAGEHLPLVKALRKYDGHDTEILEMLLTRGADINLMHRGWNGILQAVENGDAHILKLLIDKGGPVDLQAKDESGRPVIDIVTERGWEEGLSLMFPNADARQRSLSLSSWRWLTPSISQKPCDDYDSDCDTGSSMTLPDR
ncbi:ankyrin [Melanomma pulvis-pyrius CBS 109.77]|uniref:Ankyrin n=1 Tax=Melanomma pulvis-pyrius CBS 109.77 TaxID=1314802 RepID=A0A6A6XBJ4_9PLEO|nr:ankyrin [Melanomma pulvis-pyrius CBS 109.77]